MPDPLTDAATSIQRLLESGNTELALKTLEYAVNRSKTYEQYRQILTRLCSMFPPEALEHSPLVFARVLCGAREAPRLLELCEEVRAGEPPELWAYRCWGWVQTEQHSRVLEVPQHLGGSLPERERGLFWRARGEALAHEKRSDWRESFGLAYQDLKDEALGRCLIEEGEIYDRLSQTGEAIRCWSEALRYLRQDPYYMAWARYNLGMALFRSDPYQAEPYLLEAEHLSRRAEKFRARALCGLGAVRRAAGEWPRALFAYQMATKAGGDENDRQQALWGQGLVLRLMKKLPDALGCFEDALALNVPKKRWINADIAATYLTMGAKDSARAAIGRVGDLGPRSALLTRLVKAELARLDGNPKWAAGLDDLKPNLWLREEAYCLPELFACLQTLGRLPRVRPAEAVPLRVEVRCLGMLEVRVNGRLIPLVPTGKPGELLVRLLLSGKEDGLDELIADLYEKQYKTGRKRAAQQNLWAVAEALGEALGWEQSIHRHGKGYRLDPEAQWSHDIPDQPIPNANRFLQGMPGDWIARERTHLEGFWED